jgi:hypothetical protein
MQAGRSKGRPVRVGGFSRAQIVLHESMSNRYFQCRLRLSDLSRLPHDQGKMTEQVLWIEERGAKVGACIELVGDGYWNVIEVYGQMDGVALREKQQRDRGSLPSIVGN